MIATGNHDFERFAALCNTPGGSQGAVAEADSIQHTARLREAAGRLLGDPKCKTMSKGIDNTANAKGF